MKSKAILIVSLIITVVISGGLPFRDSDEAFAQGGPRLRCGTTAPDQAASIAIQNKMQQFRISSPQARQSRAPGSVEIQVCFNVIRSGPGLANGDLPQSTVDAQIARLNAAYSGAVPGSLTRANTPFRFRLVTTAFVENANWFNNIAIGSQAERDAKRNLRLGGGEVLNIYTVGNPRN